MLSAFLGEPLVGPSELEERPTAVVGWGRKHGSRKGIAYAKAHSLPYWSLEEGFVSYPPSGTKTALVDREKPPYSIICDTQGIYYDATRESDIETLLNNTKLNEQQLAFAQRCRQKTVSANITKYNDTECFVPEVLDTQKDIVLVVEQIYRDKSIHFGLADKHSFHRMLDAALDENPHAQIILKTHPRIISGKLPGYLTYRAKKYNNVFLCADYVNPLYLLKHVNKVYTVSSQMGFEGLLVDKMVRCFGMPFYAGWGVTTDDLYCQRRQAQLSIDEVFDVAYLKYPRYLHPVTRERCDYLDIVDHILLQHQVRSENKGKWLCLGMNRSRQSVVNHYFQGASEIVYRDDASTEELEDYDGVLTWGRHPVSQSSKEKMQVCRVDEGILCPQGLGLDESKVLSLVVDDLSQYNDGRQISRLEFMLNNHQFTDTELALTQKAKDYYIAKTYQALPDDIFHGLEKELFSRQVILIPSEDYDAESVANAVKGVKTCLDLLALVRRANPTAFIILGHDKKGPADEADEEESLEPYLFYCDVMIPQSSIFSALGVADEVHTISSLIGFEALMRNKKVFTYGMPFYAGWGLSQDRASFVRRTRRLNLLELVCGALFIYPRYYHQDSDSFTTLNHLLKYLNQFSKDDNKLTV